MKVVEKNGKNTYICQKNDKFVKFENYVKVMEKLGYDTEAIIYYVKDAFTIEKKDTEYLIIEDLVTCFINDGLSHSEIKEILTNLRKYHQSYPKIFDQKSLIKSDMSKPNMEDEILIDTSFFQYKFYKTSLISRVLKNNFNVSDENIEEILKNTTTKTDQEGNQIINYHNLTTTLTLLGYNDHHSLYQSLEHTQKKDVFMYELYGIKSFMLDVKWTDCDKITAGLEKDLVYAPRYGKKVLKNIQDLIIKINEIENNNILFNDDNTPVTLKELIKRDNASISPVGLSKQYQKIMNSINAKDIYNYAKTEIKDISNEDLEKLQKPKTNIFHNLFTNKTIKKPYNIKRACLGFVTAITLFATGKNIIQNINNNANIEIAKEIDDIEPTPTREKPQNVIARKSLEDAKEVLKLAQSVSSTLNYEQEKAFQNAITNLETALANDSDADVKNALNELINVETVIVNQKHNSNQENTSNEEITKTNTYVPIEFLPDANDPVELKSYDRAKKMNQEIQDIFKRNGLEVDVIYDYRPLNSGIGYANSRSFHRIGRAIDIIPHDMDFIALRDFLITNEEIRAYFTANNLGVIDETHECILKQTGGPTAHFHIGPDQMAKRMYKGWEYLDTYCNAIKNIANENETEALQQETIEKLKSWGFKDFEIQAFFEDAEELLEMSINENKETMFVLTP